MDQITMVWRDRNGARGVPSPSAITAVVKLHGNAFLLCLCDTGVSILPALPVVYGAIIPDSLEYLITIMNDCVAGLCIYSQ